MINKFFEDPDEDTLDLKDEIMDFLDKKPTVMCIMSLACAITEIIAQTAPSKERAIEGVAAVTATIMASLEAFEEENLCRWNNKIQ